MTAHRFLHVHILVYILHINSCGFQMYKLIKQQKAKLRLIKITLIKIKVIVY